MDTKLENALDDFNTDENQEENLKLQSNKKVILNQREGLIERIDRTFVTNDGRFLLREQY